MSTYDKIWWLQISGGLTGLGLVLSYLAMRRRGLRAGMRGAAWSLLPLAAYLTGSIKMFWKMGVAIGDFAKGFAFSPRVWSGIAVAGVALLLLVSTGGVRRRTVKGGDGAKPAVPSGASGAAGAGGAGGGATAAIAPRADTKPRKQKQADGDDDFKDIEEILRRRGIS